MMNTQLASASSPLCTLVLLDLPTRRVSKDRHSSAIQLISKNKGSQDQPDSAIAFYRGQKQPWAKKHG
ncbi:hypothetical protein HYQ46_002606 [Verticillium longisporum]|nr:hypothetical protein HYQ46_002606 [Verticillium longisporum]